MSVPTFTKTFHNAPYAAISPRLPGLSMAGKTVLVTGGGYGIGAAIVKAFAEAGAAHIVITGRKSGPLQDTKTTTERASKSKVHVFVADVTDASAINATFKSVHDTVGKIDVVVNNAGFLPTPNSFKDSDVADWWNGFEVNVKGTFIVAQAFLKHAADNAVFLGLSTSIVHLGVFPGFSSYAASKTATVRALEFMQGENPNIRVISVQPGVVATDMNKKSGITTMPYDDIDLPAHFLVWAASPEAEFLKGRLLWSNWDVDELKARKDEIIKENKLVLGLQGWV